MRLTSLLPLSVLFVSIACSAGCAPESPEESDEDMDVTDSALREGVIADGEHPEVGLITTEKGYCTATLIGRRTVLTAAHCFGFSSGFAPMSQPAFGTFSLTLKNNKSLSVPYHRYRADANVLQVGFDIGVAQLDAPIPEEGATPATIAEEWPDNDETLTTYGYGRFDKGCKKSDAGPKHKRKAVIDLPDGFWKRVTCPGDSGGPYFWTGTNEIVATVKGDGLGVEWVADAVKHRDWILRQLEASERGELQIDD